MLVYRLYSVINIKMSLRAIDGARTRGLDLGKVARYQLRHYRICRTNSTDLIIIHDFTYFVNVIFVFFHVQNMLLSADNQSGWWESNPRIQLGRLVFYHWTTPAKCPEPESNQWHEDFQSSALPTELSGHIHRWNWSSGKKNCGDRIWTYDLRVMSPTSFQTAPPRVT